MNFLDIPIEILPEILTCLVKASDLASACRVNKTFHSFAVPLLYQAVCIYAWHVDGKKKEKSSLEL